MKVSINLDMESKARLDRLAKQVGTSGSKVVRTALLLMETLNKSKEKQHDYREHHPGAR